MRALVSLVGIEFLVLVLLGWLLLRGEPAATAAHTAAAGPPATQAPAAVSGQASQPEPMPLERREAAPAVPEIVDADPVGIVVTGVVRSSDGTPIEAARVDFHREPEYHGGATKTAGKYAAAGLQPGEWQVSCRAEGFAPYTATSTLDRRAFQQFDIELHPAYVVRVKVQAADGKSIMADLVKALSLATLTVVATEQPLAGDLPITEYGSLYDFGIGAWEGFSQPGAEGNKQLMAQGYAGELRLFQPPPAHAALLLRHVLLQTQRIDAGQREVVFTLAIEDVMSRLGTIKLRLLDGVTGAPVAGYRVMVMTGQGGGSRQTDADGRLLMEHVTPGLLELQAGMKDRESCQRLLRVPPGAVIDLGDITLMPAIKVTGTVVDADGKPVDDATVHWYELDSRTAPLPLSINHNLRADGEGRFEHGSCGPHRYLFTAGSRTHGFGFAAVDARTGTPPPVTITVAASPRVMLHVAGDRTTGYLVSVLTADRLPVATRWLGSDARPESMSLPPGSFTIEIHDANDRLLRSFPLQVGSEPTSIEVP